MNKYIIFTKHAKIRLYERLRKKNIKMSMYKAMKRVGRLAATILTVTHDSPKRYNIEWEYGTLRVVLVDHWKMNITRYIVTVIL